MNEKSENENIPLAKFMYLNIANFAKTLIYEEEGELCINFSKVQDLKQLVECYEKTLDFLNNMYFED